jgi:hypothetical protein
MCMHHTHDSCTLKLWLLRYFALGVPERLVKDNAVNVEKLLNKRAGRGLITDKEVSAKCGLNSSLQEAV